MYDYEKKGRYIVEFQDIPTERQHQIEIEVDERRGNYSEVELGFDEERALKEAKRCLSCRRCLGRNMARPKIFWEYVLAIRQSERHMARRCTIFR